MAETDAERDKAFKAERRKRRRRSVAVQRETMARLQTLLDDTEAAIVKALADQPSEYELWRLGALREALADARVRLARDGNSIVATGLDDAFKAGADMVDAPLSAAGVDLSGVMPRIDLGALDATKDFMTGKMREVAADVIAAIDGDLVQVVAGVIAPSEAIKRVHSRLDTGGRKRALTIVRTEVGGAFSAATQTRMEQASDHLPGLKKQWRRSGKIHSRMHHDLADGQIVDVDKPFVVGGREIAYPRAPDIPVGERVNCGCATLPHMDSWTVSTPGRKAFTEEEQTLNPRKRDLEDALSGGFDPATAVRGLMGREMYEETVAWAKTQRRRGVSFADLTDAEIAAIRGYTGDAAEFGEGKEVYRLLNSALRGGRESQVVADYARVLGDALGKLPAHEGWTYRGASLPKDVAAGLIEGADFSDRGFLSVSTARHQAFSGDVVFHINSRTGRDIAPFSFYANEAEVLFRPGRKFRILKTDERDGVLHVIMDEQLYDPDRLTEADARQSTAAPESERERLLREAADAIDDIARARAAGKTATGFGQRWAAKGQGMFGLDG